MYQTPTGYYNGHYRQVRASTTANITISSALVGGQTLDGLTLATGDMVLVKNQTAPAENGIYIVGATPIRDPSYNSDFAIRGSKVLVREGTAGAGFIWACGNTSAITVGSTSITYTRTFYEIIQSSVQYTCKTVGGDFSSIADFVTFVNQYAISGNAFVDLVVDAGTWILTSGILINHPNKDRIRIYGNKLTRNLAATGSINSVGSRTQEGATNYWYRDYVLNIDDTTDIVAGDFLGIPYNIANGNYREFIMGCHEVQSVQSSTRLTVRVYNSVFNNAAYIASGNITGVIYGIKTLIDTRTALTFEGMGLIDGVVFKYYTAFPSLLQTAKTNFTNVGFYGGSRGMTTNGGIVNFTSCWMSRCGTDEGTYLINNTTLSQGTLVVNGSAQSGVLIKGNSTATTVCFVIGSAGAYGLYAERFAKHSCVGDRVLAGAGYGIYCMMGAGMFVQIGMSLLNANTDWVASNGGYIEILESSPNYAAPVITGTTSTLNKVITSMSTTSYLKVGMAISGTGIPSGATIASIDSTSQITFSASGNGTANGANSHTYMPTLSPANLTADSSGAVINYHT